MSLAQTTTRPLSTKKTSPVNAVRPFGAVAAGFVSASAAAASAAANDAAVTAADAAAATQPPSGRLRAVPNGVEARGFVLYVGIDEDKAAADGTDVASIVAQLRALAAKLSPSSESYAAVALAPRGVGGRDVDIVRLALQDPAALAKRRQGPEAEDEKNYAGVVIDLSRKRVLLDHETAGLTYKEFELLQYLVLREGKTIDRAELISSLWKSDDDEAPNERTIDVHVRRLRAKLGHYEDIVRTVRGVGYRFDRHADVSVRHTSTPSPDLF